MLVESIKLTNFLSFGKISEPVQLGKLNVLIGPNGSGKSNLLEAFELLRNAPEQLQKPIREGGGVGDWIWKGGNSPKTATLDAVFFSRKNNNEMLRYVLSFSEVGQRFEIVDERIENQKPYQGHDKPYFYYHFNNGHPMLNVGGESRSLQREDIALDQSVLSQRRDPDQYPEVTYLGQAFAKIRLYRDWSFGRYTPPRLPQKTDLPNYMLEPDASNLGLVLNRFRQDPPVKRRLRDALRVLYEGIDDFDGRIEGGTVQVFLEEAGYTVPATRLSDGTLRYLCLLSILCHPTPPPLVCIEEPELGLHPDILPTIAELLSEASERCQIIVTTHSDILVDALTDKPESILVCEKGVEGTTLQRLNAKDLKPWLKQYRLGELWTRGEIGGLRW